MLNGKQSLFAYAHSICQIDNVTEACVMKLSMATANAGQIEHAQPGPIDGSVLTEQPNHQSEAICNGQDPRSFTCHSRNEEFSNREPMVEDQVVDIIKALGLEGLLWILGIEIDHDLIMALVERWWPETHTFHMPHGEVTITLQDVEVLLGLPVDGEAITRSTQKEWVNMCWDFLGFQPVNNERKQLDGQRILIKWLLEQVVDPLPRNAEEDQVHKYAQCYILALLGHTIFVDKSGDRVHLMWVQELKDLSNPRRWLWVPNKKNRPAYIFLKKYREQIASMLLGQVVWQPYEAELEDLLPWCIAGRAMWTASVPLVCFHLIEKHTPDRVVRQFEMIQEDPHAVNTDMVLHGIDLMRKVRVNWTHRHAEHIREWGNHLRRRCEVVLGDMPLAYEYFDWFKRVTRRFIDVLGARLILMGIKEPFIGEAVGCTFQGSFYLVTENGLAVVLPSISVSSNFLPIEPIGYQLPSISRGIKYQVRDILVTTESKQPWPLWKLEVLDRVLLYESTEVADCLCLENGWDLKILRMRQLQIALDYLKFDEIDRSLEMLVRVNLVEEGILRLLSSVVHLMLCKSASENEASSASRTLTTGGS
ncbi:hypothetical protein SO802_017880 [Lithocarpus litseifolius]|uniref:Aminotransferase-like plant mobile domain-containing protein n=1 Tax=Lithocarpus litseifolius TaxID=425828 RepID=A0AAW2CJE2_9ROSI